MAAGEMSGTLDAAYHDHPETVAALLAHGADHARVHAALAAATFRRSPDAVRALLDADADPALGRQSALATVAVFELPDTQELLTTGRGR